MIKVMLIDDEPEIRKLLHKMVERQPDYQVVAEGGDFSQAVIPFPAAGHFPRAFGKGYQFLGKRRRGEHLQRFGKDNGFLRGQRNVAEADNENQSCP